MNKKYIVYFLNADGMRDGMEVIEASSREEAEEIYRRSFNVRGKCTAVLRWESK